MEKGIREKLFDASGLKLCFECCLSRVSCCQVLWNGHDFSSPSRWDKVFCMTVANNQLWLDVRCAVFRDVCARVLFL